MQVSGQGNGKILGVDAFLVSISLGIMENGLFTGEVYSTMTTMAGQTVNMKVYAVGGPSDNCGLSRDASVQTTASENFLSELCNTFV